MKSQTDRKLLLILPTSFLMSFAIGVVNLGMLFVVKEDYHASPAAVGWFAALWSMAYLAGCLSLRVLYKYVKASISMTIACLGSALLFVVHIVFPGLISAFIVYGLYGFITAFFWPRVMGWVSSGVEGAALGKASGLFNVAWSTGGIIAPFAGGLLSERSTFLPIWVGIAIFCLAGLFVLVMSRFAPSPSLKPDKQVVENDEIKKDTSTVLRYPAWVGIFLLYALIAVFFNIFPLYAKDELGLSESRIGLILLVRALATSIGFWFFGRFGFWHFRRKMLFLPVLLTLALDLAFIFIRSPLLLGIGVGVAGFLLAAAYSASMFYGASGALDRERRMTAHESSLTAGQILGSILGGAVYQSLSWASVFTVLAFLLAAGAATQLFMLGRGKR